MLFTSEQPATLEVFREREDSVRWLDLADESAAVERLLAQVEPLPE